MVSINAFERFIVYRGIHCKNSKTHETVNVNKGIPREHSNVYKWLQFSSFDHITIH